MKTKVVFLGLLISLSGFIFSQTPGTDLFSGNWGGMVKQPGTSDYSVEMQLQTNSDNETSGFTFYPKYNCVGKLSFLSRDDNSIRLQEKIISGRGCVDLGEILLKSNTDKTLTFDWFYPSKQLGAQASLQNSPISDRLANVIRSQFPNTNIASTNISNPTSANSQAPTNINVGGNSSENSNQNSSQSNSQNTNQNNSPSNTPPQGSASTQQQSDVPSMIELEGEMIRLNDSICILGGCAEECKKYPESCPGGEQAAMNRGAWRDCSDNGWQGKNCEIIISRFGQHSQLTAISIPQNFQSIYSGLLAGKPFQLNETNLAFVSGLGRYLTETCKVLGPQDARVVDQFARSGLTFATLGNNYMNPGQNIGTATSAALTVKAGVEVGQSIACRLPESYVLAKGMVESIKVSEGTEDNKQSRFVESCTRQFSGTQCQCLADLGRATHSDINNRTYNRNIIYEIIERNPMLGLAIGFQCKIYNY